MIRQVEPTAPAESKPMTDQERSEAIKRQVEYYFSRQNLLQDTFLLSKMSKDHYVDLSVIAEFKMIKQLTSDVDLILKSIKDSDKVVIDEARKCVKPAAHNERTTLILRNIPSSASEESVKSLLKTVNVPAIVSIRADVGDNWFLSFETTEATKTAMERVKSLKWEDKQIGCAIKSESFLKGLALLPANAIPYNATAPYVVANGESSFRANGVRRTSNGSGRRFNNDGQESNGRKPSAGKKGKARNGSRDAKEAGGTASPQNQNTVPQAPLKPSDFPVLGSAPAAPDVVAEASSAASTPPLCNTPPPASDSTATSADTTSVTRGKVSYAQMAQASVAAGNNAVKAQATN
jgi:hypothetical protein